MNLRLKLLFGLSLVLISGQARGDTFMGYDELQQNGTKKPHRSAGNFTSGATLTDDPTNNRTNISISGAGGSPGGSGSNLQYRVDASTFGGITNSSVSGANLTLGGTLTLNQNAQPSIIQAPTSGDAMELSTENSTFHLIDQSTGNEGFRFEANRSQVFLAKTVTLGSGGTNSSTLSADASGNFTLLSTGTITLKGPNLVSATFPNVEKTSFGITVDGGGSAITTGVKGFISIPYNMTITGWDIFADQSGSAQFDVWKTTYAGAMPTVSNTIAGSQKPLLSSTQKNTSSSVSSWTTAVTAGDVIGFNVDSATTVTRVTVVIKGSKT